MSALVCHDDIVDATMTSTAVLDPSLSSVALTDLPIGRSVLATVVVKKFLSMAITAARFIPTGMGNTQCRIHWPLVQSAAGALHLTTSNLSGVALRTRTKSTELPFWNDAARLFMKSS